MAELRRTRLPAPYRGLDLASSPDVADPETTRHINNFLVGNPGLLRLRSKTTPIVSGNVADVADRTRQPVGLWELSGQSSADYTFYVTRSWDSTKIKPHQTPWRHASNQSELDWAYSYNMVSGVYAKWSGSPSGQRSVSFIGRPVRLGPRSYVYSYDSFGDHATTTTTSTGWPGPMARVRSLLALTEASPAIDQFIYFGQSAPQNGQAVISHLNRVWVLGGYAPHLVGGTPDYEPNTLFFSREAHLNALPTTAVAGVTAWSDEVTNLLNRIVVGKDGGGWGVGLAVVDQNLVIFKNNSLWVLYGNSPSTFSLRQIDGNTGCIEPNSIYEADGGVYFLSQRGLEFFDGYSVTTVSNPVRELLEPYCRAAHNGSSSLSAVVGNVGHDYLRLSLNFDALGNAPLNLMLHRPSGAWTIFSGASYSVWSYTSGNTGQRGCSWTNGAGVECHQRVTQARPMDFVDGSAPVLTGSFAYRLATPSSHLEGLQLHRVLLNSALNVEVSESSPPDSITGTTFMLRSSTGKELGSGVFSGLAKHESDDPTVTFTQRRQVFDVFTESAGDLLLRVNHAPTGAALPYRSEYYDAYAEWQLTNQRRSTRRGQ